MGREENCRGPKRKEKLVERPRNEDLEKWKKANK